MTTNKFSCCDAPYVKFNGGLMTCLTCRTHHGDGRLKINVKLSTDAPNKEDKR